MGFGEGSGGALGGEGAGSVRVGGKSEWGETLRERGRESIEGGSVRDPQEGEERRGGRERCWVVSRGRGTPFSESSRWVSKVTEADPASSFFEILTLRGLGGETEPSPKPSCSLAEFPLIRRGGKRS